MNRKGNTFATNFLEKCGISLSTDIPIEEIIGSEGAHIQTCKIEGAEGRIMFNGDGADAIISISDAINLETKKRFVLAHELGHLIMHRQQKRILTDTDLTLSEYSAKEVIEIEANSFASEFLMPENEFKKMCTGRFNLDLIKKIAQKFHTSTTATLLRYKDIGNYPIAVIYSEGGLIKWKFFSPDFVLQFIPTNSPIPINTIAYDIFKAKYNSTEPEQIDAIDWFPNDFNIKRYMSWKFWEYSFRVSEKGILTCLWGY
jgi:hypothetical protein